MRAAAGSVYAGQIIGAGQKPVFASFPSSKSVFDMTKLLALAVEKAPALPLEMQDQAARMLLA
jgi:hypothetical protein